MKVRMTELRGVTTDLHSSLREHGMKDSDQLLDVGRTLVGRKELASKTGADPKYILELVNRADLARIRGIGSAYSNLLEEAGVDTVKELATRRADNLFAKLLEVNAAKKLVGRTPTQQMVQDWVNQAKELPKFVEY